ncbi:MAG: succinate--CoA ligase subunit alpha [Chloroflexota bacterium]|nr:succinate--CoA ligase subunit alpha [Chloroflexota bacterium]MDE2841664.1 succinate--CoA ligase subunit alpha [Chloroflexota bacterium]MDE2930953.1 succinate--CoA ligase subunit alpha [Chloroflexota bacterium]
MSILVDENTRLLVQGITGREGTFHTEQMVQYGTQVVAGVTPGRGGQKACGVPVFNTVAQAVRETGANVSIIFVPGPFAPDAIIEAVDAGIPFVVCISEHIPVQDMLRAYHYVNIKGARLQGPNCPGLISPGKAKVGIMAGDIHIPGPVGVVSRSGTLTYEVVSHLTGQGVGQSTVVGIGGDPVIGTGFIDVLRMFEQDPETEAVVMIGEIGGTDEEEAAAFIQKHMTKPVVGFIAGRTAPPEKRMGHAGAIVSGGIGTAESKIAALQAAGVDVADFPREAALLAAERILL